MNFNNSSGMANSASRVLAIIGFVALIIIGMYGSVRVAQAVPGFVNNMAAAIVSITSIFVPANETIAVSLPGYTVQHDTPVPVAFEHANKKVNGTYTFRYSCVEGVSISTVSGDGSVVQIGCNQPYAFQPFNNSITVTPMTGTTRFADTEVFVSFTPEGTGTATVSGSAVMTIENTKLSATNLTPGGTETPTTPSTPTTPTTPVAPVTPKPQPPRTTVVVPQQRVSDPNGFVDLTARVIEIGVIDSTGAFTASTTPNRTSRIAVRYAVENIGTKTSKEFAFSAVLPTYPPYTYFSTPQVPLGPGDRIEFTIGFDSFELDNTGDFIVNVDPTGSVNEKDKANNIIKYPITIVK